MTENEYYNLTKLARVFLHHYYRNSSHRTVNITAGMERDAIEALSEVFKLKDQMYDEARESNPKPSNRE